MPASQPVDYLAALQRLLRHRLFNEYDGALESLASQLTALRESVKGCSGKTVEGYEYCGRRFDNGTVLLCDACECKLFAIITALTYTTQGGE